MYGKPLGTDAKYVEEVVHEVSDCTLSRVASMDVGECELVVDVAGCKVFLHLGGGLVF